MKILFKSLWRITFVAGLLITVASVHAHHSFALFDSSTQKTIEGTIVEFQWTNPHSWTWINVANEAGGVDKWGLEGMSPNFLGRRGWSKNTLKPGDKVSIVIFPLKNGDKGGTFLRVTMPDGETKVMFGDPAVISGGTTP